MDGDSRNDHLLRTVYSTSLICPIITLLGGNPWPSTGTLNWQSLLEIAGGSHTDAELLKRALFTSRCLQPVSGDTDSYHVDDAWSASLVASVAIHDDVLTAIISAARAGSAAEQVRLLSVAEWLT